MRIMMLLILAFLTVKSYAQQSQTLIVAGGCFWCVESDFEKHQGVLDVESGYINGTVANPSYRQVASKKTGHFEVAKITYDPAQVSLEPLLTYFWHTIDPTDPDGQFCDKGSPYKTGLFYQNAEQESAFRASLASIEKTKPFDKDIVTEVLEAQTFYSAEDYHQDYYKKNPLRYKYYRTACRRDARVKKLWGKVVSGKH